MSTQETPNPRWLLTAPQIVSHQSALSVGLAISAAEIESAQRLRYKVFAEELGARLVCPVPRVDEDIFDPFCHHLVVRDNRSGTVVGTYRILPPENATMIGR